MPVVMCGWCHYIAQGESDIEKIEDAYKHEENCVWFVDQ